MVFNNREQRRAEAKAKKADHTDTEDSGDEHEDGNAKKTVLAKAVRAVNHHCPLARLGNCRRRKGVNYCVAHMVVCAKPGHNQLPIMIDKGRGCMQCSNEEDAANRELSGREAAAISANFLAAQQATREGHLKKKHQQKR